MASDDLSDEGILEALRAIPESLRGITWLTTSQLALVAGVTETALNSVLRPLKANCKALQRVMVDKSMPHSAGDKYERTIYYRPYTYMTSVVSNRMNGEEERTQNEASFSVGLRAALGQESLPATPIDAPGPTVIVSADEETSRGSRLAGRKRRSDALADASQSSSSKPKASEAAALERPKSATLERPKSAWIPSFPMAVERFAPFAEDDGSIAYINFAGNKYDKVRLAVVFTPPKKICSSSDPAGLKWEVEYAVWLRGARVREGTLEVVHSSSLHAQIKGILKSSLESHLCVGVNQLAQEGARGEDGGWMVLTEGYRSSKNVRAPSSRWGTYEVGSNKTSDQCTFILEDYGEGEVIRSSSCSGFSESVGGRCKACTGANFQK